MHREKFQIYNQNNSPALVYLDSSATSLTPDIVIQKMNDYYLRYRSNIHRGLYEQAEKATEEYEKSKDLIAQFIHTASDNICITSGATASSNLLALLIEKNIDIQKGDEIVISKYAHNSELLPLKELALRTGAKLIIDHTYISSRTKIVSVPLVSNVTGKILDVKNIAKKARQFGAFVICDATAAVSHVEVNAEELEVDALYFSWHKAFGPTGVGVLYLKGDIPEKWQTVNFGGGMVENATSDQSVYVEEIHKFEAGTMPIAEVIGAGAAVLFINEVGISNIRQHVTQLINYAYAKLSELPYVNFYSELNSENNSGIISFNINNVHSHDVAQILANEGVCVRAGAHCAHLCMLDLCTNSVCRVSLHLYNTKEDIDKLSEAIQKAYNTFN